VKQAIVSQIDPLFSNDIAKMIDILMMHSAWPLQEWLAAVGPERKDWDILRNRFEKSSFLKE